MSMKDDEARVLALLHDLRTEMIHLQASAHSTGFINGQQSAIEMIDAKMEKAMKSLEDNNSFETQAIYPKTISESQKDGKYYIVWDALAKDWFKAKWYNSKQIRFRYQAGLAGWYTFENNTLLLKVTHYVPLLPIE